MSHTDRYAITPQMADYDQIGRRQQWVPYLMLFCEPDCVFPSVTTDCMGFRTTLDADDRPIKSGVLHSSESFERCSVVVGGSTVFGVGATHDRHTIPSVLNRVCRGVWTNLGGRAFNSTQEVILFLLHMPRRPERILLFSGVNNLAMTSINQGASPIYGAFIHQRRFEAAMNNRQREHYVRRLIDRLSKGCRRLLTRNRASGTPPYDLAEHSSDMLTCFDRDLRVFNTLARGLGVPLYFALQPLATWIDKRLSPEEQEIFALLDKLQGPEWQVLKSGLGLVRDQYFGDLARICAREGVPFCNMNHEPVFREDSWLFVDRVHLTDRGHAADADVLKREFNL